MELCHLSACPENPESSTYTHIDIVRPPDEDTGITTHFKMINMSQVLSKYPINQSFPEFDFLRL